MAIMVIQDITEDMDIRIIITTPPTPTFPTIGEGETLLTTEPKPGAEPTMLELATTPTIVVLKPPDV